MILKISTLIILTAATLRAAIISTRKRTSKSDNQFVYTMFVTVVFYLTVLGVI